MVVGDCFGELSIFDGKPAHQDGVADTDTVLMRLAEPDFHELRHAYPEVNEALLAFFARRVRSVYELIDDAYLLDVPHRLARAFCCCCTVLASKIIWLPVSRCPTRIWRR
ncbi:MAG: Crp/Fnr family transcriptional regulator [Rhodobacteraceae bacterium]|nr:Crp/Fnr family transcriptional regulator [Paracoccaceae bacterium]